MIFNKSAYSLDVELIGGKNSFRLKERLYGYDRKSGVHVCVEPGFCTDLATVPSIARSFVSNHNSKIHLPSIVHDWIYRHSGRMPAFKYDDGKETLLIARARISRKEADLIFYRGLIGQGANKFKAAAMYLAVRIFGRFFWNGT